MRVMTWNLFNWTTDETAQERERQQRTARLIRDMAPDVLAVQELYGEHESALSRLRWLAAETGLACIGPQGPALGGAASDRYHNGLLWNEATVDPLPGTQRCYTGEMWHDLVWLELAIAGRAVRVASYHAAPFGRHRRADEAERVINALVRGDRVLPVLVGADWNSVSADRVLRAPGWGADAVWEHYDHDPYVDAVWHSAFVHQTRWSDTDLEGRWWADREPGEVLQAGGLRDAAAVLDVPWQATTGHWDGDPFPPRRIDGVRVTDTLTSALTAHQVVHSDETRALSDHLPVVLDLDHHELPTV